VTPGPDLGNLFDGDRSVFTYQGRVGEKGFLNGDAARHLSMPPSRRCRPPLSRQWGSVQNETLRPSSEIHDSQGLPSIGGRSRHPVRRSIRSSVSGPRW
jgi:hypothetical protein